MKARALLAFFVLGHAAAAQDNRVSLTLAGLDGLYPEVEKLYLDLHQNPELSLQEEKTAAKLAARLRALGALRRAGRDHPATVRLDRAHDAALVLAERLAILHVDVGDEIDAHEDLSLPLPGSRGARITRP